ncbi:thioredoxin-dependent thiol peroxidase [bacterium]|nr:thioredoxin-dependent thiol peroxidase [bacterium]
MTQLKVRDQAPDFTLDDQSGDKVRLRDFRGKIVVLYFYSKDGTPGCTREACDFRDYEKDFTRLNVVVLGVSRDSREKHRKFMEKYGLPFRLLADEELHTLKAYGVWQMKKMMGCESMGVIRSTFVINPIGKIDKIYYKVRVGGHVANVLDELKKELR